MQTLKKRLSIAITLAIQRTLYGDPVSIFYLINPIPHNEPYARLPQASKLVYHLWFTASRLNHPTIKGRPHINIYIYTM